MTDEQIGTLIRQYRDTCRAIKEALDLLEKLGADLQRAVVSFHNAADNPLADIERLKVDIPCALNRLESLAGLRAEELRLQEEMKANGLEQFILPRSPRPLNIVT